MIMRVYSPADDDDDLEDDSILLLNYRIVVNSQQIQTINIRQFVEFIFVIHSSFFASHLCNLEGVRNVFYITDAILPPPDFRFSSLLLQSILIIQKLILPMSNKCINSKSVVGSINCL
jgi:hypothetical protein